ncbi:MAG: tRNA (adenosine(37)-N6)-threonylcarbamoyltransferase complex dimerization subunit type 1 TsaB [Lacipirellulaceae bacterium]
MPPESFPPTGANQPRGTGRMVAIETSGRFGSVAAVEGVGPGEPRLVAAIPLPRDERSARTLAPALAALLEAAAWERGSIGCVAVASGPGSFTGLRVGVTTAKALAYAWRADLVAIDTLAALAREAEPTARGWALIDAQRGELFAAPFAGQVAEATRRLSLAAVLAELRQGDTVLGPGVDALDDAAGAPTAITWQDLEPSAAAVARLAWPRWLAGETEDPLTLVPEYYRTSAAEEKRAAQGT